MWRGVNGRSRAVHRRQPARELARLGGGEDVVPDADGLHARHQLVRLVVDIEIPGDPDELRAHLEVVGVQLGRGDDR